MIERLDRDVGRLLALLTELGVDKKTIVFFSSDNGPHREGGANPEFFDSNGPLRGIKRDLYGGGIRVPLLVRWPGRIAPASTSDHISASVCNGHPVPRPFDPERGAVMSGGAVPPVPDVALGTPQPLAAASGFAPLGDPKVNRLIRGEPLKIGGKEFSMGIGVHAVSELVYEIKPGFREFVAGVEPDDERAGSMVFGVYADAKHLAKSPLLTKGMLHYFRIPVPEGVKQLRLITTDGGNGIGGDHGDWVNAGFLTQP